MLPDIIIKTKGDARASRGTYLRHRTLADMTASLAWSRINAADYQAVRGRPQFTGTESITEYESMLRDGWVAGVKDVEGLDGLSSDHAERLQFVRNVAGAFPNVPAYLTGAPDAMLQPVIRPVESVRSLTLVINASYGCGIESETALTYARAVMRLVAWLQAEQIDVAIYASIAMQSTRPQSSNIRMHYLIPIRELGDVFQPERIAASLHPSFLRRGWFSLVERDYIERDLPGAASCTRGYGYPQTASMEELTAALPDAAAVILLPKVGCSDPDKAVRDAVNLKLKHKE